MKRKLKNNYKMTSSGILKPSLSCNNRKSQIKIEESMINIIGGKSKIMVCNPTPKPTKCYLNKKLGKILNVNDHFVYSRILNLCLLKL